MKVNKRFVTLGLVLALCLAALPTGAAFADADTVGCGDNGGTWTDTGAGTGTCSYPPDTFGSQFACLNDIGSAVYYYQNTGEGLQFLNYVCFTPVYPFTHTDICKLLDIDAQFGIGQLFRASWIGRLQSLRFRGNRGTYFVAPISRGWIPGAHVGTFTAYLPEGTYWVSCVGLAHSGVGGELRVEIFRGKGPASSSGK